MLPPSDADATAAALKKPANAPTAMPGSRWALVFPCCRRSLLARALADAAAIGDAQLRREHQWLVGR